MVLSLGIENKNFVFCFAFLSLNRTFPMEGQSYEKLNEKPNFGVAKNGKAYTFFMCLGDNDKWLIEVLSLN